MEAYLMSLDGDTCLSVLNRENNEKSKEVILRGLSKADVDEVRHGE